MLLILSIALWMTLGASFYFFLIMNEPEDFRDIDAVAWTLFGVILLPIILVMFVLEQGLLIKICKVPLKGLLYFVKLKWLEK